MKIETLLPTWRIPTEAKKEDTESETLLQRSDVYVHPPQRPAEAKPPVEIPVPSPGAAAYGSLHPALQTALARVFVLSATSTKPISIADVKGGWEPLRGEWSPRNYVASDGSPAAMAVVLPDTDDVKRIAQRAGLKYLGGGVFSMNYDKDTEITTRKRYEKIGIKHY